MSLEHAPQRQGASATAYLTAKQVCARYGGISAMTLWRWQADPTLNFPKPVTINRRRYFPLSLLDAFDTRQANHDEEG